MINCRHTLSTMIFCTGTRSSQQCRDCTIPSNRTPLFNKFVLAICHCSSSTNFYLWSVSGLPLIFLDGHGPSAGNHDFTSYFSITLLVSYSVSFRLCFITKSITWQNPTQLHISHFRKRLSSIYFPPISSSTSCCTPILCPPCLLC